jgi:hypothetical protein
MTLKTVGEICEIVPHMCTSYIKIVRGENKSAAGFVWRLPEAVDVVDILR